VPTLTEVIEVQAQPLPEPVVDVALPELDSAAEPVAGRVVEAAEPIDVPDLVLADAVPPLLSEQDRAVLPRAVLRPSALASGGASTQPAAPAAPAEPVVAGVSIDEAQIVQRVHADLQRQIDGMLEYRLREAMAPVLARTTELLVRELRQELSKTMKDVVARAVAQEVARQRSRQGQ
jgi:hypothetical protein